MKQAITQWIEEHANDIEGLYHQLHSIPERSWDEKETTAFLRQSLHAMGVNNRNFDGHTGLIAEWPGATPGPVVVLRSDIDALWQNIDGVSRANHACGHDAHMTMVFSALRCLKEIGFQPVGTLRVVFQPAEETGEGAKAVVEQGVLDDADYLLGIHVRPIKEMPLGRASSAIYHGTTFVLRGTVTGRQSHAARPAEGINAIDSLAAIVQAINAVKLDSTVPASCKMTTVNVPNQSINIIPDLAEFAIDMRAQTNDAMDELVSKVETAIHAAGSANGAQIVLRRGVRMAAATPNAFTEGIVRNAIGDILGEEGVAPPPVTPGGEDFHFYPLLKPRLQATMVGLGANLTPGLHHPQMSFDLSALRIGIGILALSTIRLFEKGIQ